MLPKEEELQVQSWEPMRNLPDKEINDFKDIVNAVEVEFLKASELFGPFNSAHEGWAVLKEEVDELWDEVKKKQELRSIEKMRKEAIQVAAMAIRFIYDVEK